MSITEIATIIGLNSILTVVLSSILDVRKKKKEAKSLRLFDEKYKRYNNLLARMLIIVDFSNVTQVSLEEGQKEFYNRYKEENGEERLREYLIKEIRYFFCYAHLFSSNSVVK